MSNRRSFCHLAVSLRPRALLVAATVALGLVARAWSSEPSADALTPASGAAAQGEGQVEKSGIKASARIEPITHAGVAAGTVTESGFAQITLEIRDTTTGRGVTGLVPGGWLDRLPKGLDRSSESCRKKVESFLGGGLLNAATINLNRFYVLVLNGDGTVSIVDPQLQFGGSRLLATIRPPAAATDWAIDPDGTRVWLSLPEARQILEVETFGWSTVRAIDLPISPTSLWLQPGSGRLWTVGDAPDGTAAVAVVNPADGQVVSKLPVPPGPHELVLEGDGRFALVTSYQAASVTVIDGAALTVARVERLSGELTSLAWSNPAAVATVVDRKGGAVYLVDPAGRRATRRVPVAIGITRVDAAPEVPYAVVIEPAAKRIHTIDLARGAAGQATDVLGTPDEVSFSAGLGYVHHSSTENLFTFPIPHLGNGKPLTRVAVPAGQMAPGQIVRRGSVRSVTKVYGENAVLVAAPADRAVYYYREGMAAPMGSFKSYGKTPVGVRVIDRGFREVAPGVYRTVAQLEAAGSYDLVFLVSNPSLVQCVPFTVAPAPAADETHPAARTVDVTWVGAPLLLLNQPTTLAVTLRDQETGESIDNVQDLSARISVPGRWQGELVLTPVGAAGSRRYEGTFSPPEPGAYLFFFASPSLGMTGSRRASLVLKLEPEAAEATDTR